MSPSEFLGLRPKDVTTPGTSGYDAFISYSRTDSVAAGSLKQALERFATPWYRSRGARVFLDTKSLAGGPSLRAAIEDALQSSTACVLLVSNASRTSRWVQAEVAWWLSNRGIDRLLVAVLEPPDEASAAPVAPGTVWESAVPYEWRSHFDDEPLWIDLQWMAGQDNLDNKDPRLVDAAAQILASIREVPKDQILGEHLKRSRQTRRVVTTVVITLVALLASAVVATWIANDQRNTAIVERYAATSRQLTAQSQSVEDDRPSLARQLLVEGYRLSPTEEAIGAVIRSPRLSHELRLNGDEPKVTVNAVQPITAVIDTNRLTLYATDSGRRMLTMGEKLPDDADVAFSATGDSMAVVTGPHQVSLYDVSNISKVRLSGRLRSPDLVLRVVYTPQNDVLIAESASSMTFFDVARPSEASLLNSVGVLGADEVPRLTLLDDGTLMSADLRTPSGVDVRSLPAPVLVTPLGSGDTRAAISPNGQTLAQVGEVGDVQIWDVANPARPKLRASVPAESFGVGDVAFSGDGETLAVGTLSGTTQLWNLKDVTRPILGERLRGVAAGVDSVRFGSRSTQLVVTSDDPVSLGKSSGLATKTIVRMWPVQDATRASSTYRIDGGRQAVPAWSPDGRTVVGGFPGRIWDLANSRFPRPGATLPTLAVGGGAVYAFQPGADVVASGVPVVLWDISDISSPRRLGATRVQEAAELMEFSSDGALLAAGTAFGRVAVWSVTDGDAQRLTSLPGSAASPHGADFIADDATLVVLDGHDRARLWDVGDPTAPKVLGGLTAGKDAITALVADERTQSVITGSRQGTLTAWDVSDPTSPRRLRSREAHTGPMTGIALSSDGQLLASAGEDAVRLWARDSGTGRLSPMATLESGAVYDGAALAFSPDGASLAAATNDGLQIWDVDVDRSLRELCAESNTISRAEWSDYLPEDIDYDPPCRNPDRGAVP